MTVQEFISKWKPVTLRERASVQEHFIDLCRLLEVPRLHLRGAALMDPRGLVAPPTNIVRQGQRPRYTPTTCFEIFPFPTVHGEKRQAVAAWAERLDETRNQLLATDPDLMMTTLYNEIAELREERDAARRAYPLLIAHEKLNEAVAAAYGWEWPLGNDKILTRLLARNQERAAEEETK